MSEVVFSYFLRFTCDECVEGMEFVEAYMRDPLWVAEYTLYLEQNFCVHDQVSDISINICG